MKGAKFWGAIASIAPIIPYLLLGGVVIALIDKLKDVLTFDGFFNVSPKLDPKKVEEVKQQHENLKNNGFDSMFVANRIYDSMSFFGRDEYVLHDYLEKLTSEQWKQVYFSFGSKKAQSLDQFLDSKLSGFYYNPPLRGKVAKMFKSIGINLVSF